MRIPKPSSSACTRSACGRDEALPFPDPAREPGPYSHGSPGNSVVEIESAGIVIPLSG